MLGPFIKRQTGTEVNFNQPSMAIKNVTKTRQKKSINKLSCLYVDYVCGRHVFCKSIN